VLASLEDALGVQERPNTPGTLNSTNWRMALPATLEEIEHADGPDRVAYAMRAAGRQAQTASDLNLQ
jgi:4-alpha-glucanotransferase